MVRLADNGSTPQCVKLQVQEVPAYSIIDSGADITIMGILFKKVAAVAKFSKRHLKRPDKTPRNYDHMPFTLDGQIDMDLTFDDKTMCTPVYIKADAHDQLLSEGVYRQLAIIQYLPDVEPWRGWKRKQPHFNAETPCNATLSSPEAEGTSAMLGESSHPCHNNTDAGVPTVRVRLL